MQCWLEMSSKSVSRLYSVGAWTLETSWVQILALMCDLRQT